MATGGVNIRSGKPGVFDIRSFFHAACAKRDGSALNLGKDEYSPLRGDRFAKLTAYAMGGGGGEDGIRTHETL